MNRQLAPFEQFLDFARAEGASAAALLDPKTLVVEERFIHYCHTGCPSYGLAPSCPPHTIRPRTFRKKLNMYQAALVFKVEAMLAELKGARRRHYSRLMHTLAARIEKKGKRHGFSPVMGIGAGSCKELFCLEAEGCVVLEQNQACPYQEQARISLSALGINAGLLCEQAGWKLTWQDASCGDEQTMAIMLGLVLIGSSRCGITSHRVCTSPLLAASDV